MATGLQQSANRLPNVDGVATDEVRVRIETSISTNAESDRLMSKQLVRQRN